jgi:DNA transformation protein and related proteins
MKIKADQDQSLVEFILEQLEDRLELRAKRMFGGYGLYAGLDFFGIVYRGCLYFKTDDATRSRYETAGMSCFKPNEKQTLRRYYQVPVSVMEDCDKLRAWAAEAVGVAGKESS